MSSPSLAAANVAYDLLALRCDEPAMPLTARAVQHPCPQQPPNVTPTGDLAATRPRKAILLSIGFSNEYVLNDFGSKWVRHGEWVGNIAQRYPDTSGALSGKYLFKKMSANHKTSRRLRTNLSEKT